MEVVIATPEELAGLAADAIESLLATKPTAVLGLATGSSPGPHGLLYGREPGPACFLRHAEDGDRGDLVHPQQAGQVDRDARAGLDPIGRRMPRLRWCGDYPRIGRRSIWTEPGRVP
jgi:hypothetical protein